ncbi:ATPase domain-containing protein [Rubrivirga sp. IMCC45206]|uniref:ATPase domain-containing protein n=1 Tax=Rubrivirga sp. IMCC45206 TaxID=3391614 RepID=UPI00398FEBC7
MSVPTTVRAPSGVPGFDVLLNGGFPQGRMYLLEGRPGTGKTTFALHFCREGVAAGERVLYVTLSQRAEELAEIAASHGWTLDGIDVIDAQTGGLDLHARGHTLFETDETDLEDIIDRVLAEVERLRPSRMVLDSAAEIRLLAGDALSSRRRFLALKHTLGAAGVTTLLVDDYTGQPGDGAVYSIMHGVVRLERDAPAYGDVYRRLEIPKIRGVNNPTGFHDFQIEPSGIIVYPSLSMRLADGGVADSEGRSGAAAAPATTRADGLDALLGGGVDRGSSCVVIGVSGTGKSSLAASYAISAAERGERAAIYTFDERRETLVTRMAGLGYDCRAAGDRLEIRQLSASVMTTGRFVEEVRAAADDGVGVVVIDSLSGFTDSCPSPGRAATQLHDLLAYLGDRGVVTFVTVPQHGIIGAQASSEIDVSYIADTVLLLRQFEAEGRVRKALAVVKRRQGGHDQRVREFVMSDAGLEVGAEISDYQGVLSGAPVLLGGPVA